MASRPPRIQPAAAPPWVIDLKSLPNNRPRPESSSIPNPPGFSPSAGSGGGGGKKSKPAPPSNVPTDSETDDLFVKKAWEVALAPAKTIPMNAFMMYMSGNTLQIFSIMMTAMLFVNPLRALTSVGQTFAKFENERTRQRLWIVKLSFVALQIATVLLGIWKVNGMGLLPTTRSDWLAWERERTPLEYSAPVWGVPGSQ